MIKILIVFLLPLNAWSQAQFNANDFPNPDEYVTEGLADDTKLTYDISLSSGNVGDINYTEINVGLNYFYFDWMNWRNSIFTRMASEGDDLYGLDSALRLYMVTPVGEDGGLTLFGGPGARIPSEGDTTAFAEAGIIMKTTGMTIGLGAKTFFNKLNDSDADNDTQYFIILAGAGSL